MTLRSLVPETSASTNSATRPSTKENFGCIDARVGRGLLPANPLRAVCARSQPTRPSIEENAYYSDFLPAKLAVFLRERQARGMDRIFGQFSAIIPAYNEAKTIEHAILDTKRVLGNDARVIVVDDGSSDDTGARAAQAGADVIRHEHNLGKGAAIKTGALASTSEWILVLDADLSTKPDELHRFIDALDTADIVFGSRRAAGSTIGRQQPWYRVRAGELFNALVRWVSGLPYHDTQCGFKAFRMTTCRPIFTSLVTKGWSTDVELLMRAKRLGLTLAERPVTWNHADDSRVRLSHGLRILSELYQLRRVIHSFLDD